MNITGYIWQKYPADFPADITKGVVFPEEVNLIDTRLDKFYDTTIERDGIQYDLMGWCFDVTVRQSFDYSDYPLDILTVWLRVWAKDFINDRKVILIPDFQAYAGTDRPTFGLDIDIVHGEWVINETFFSYKKMSYDTDFGFLIEPKEYSYQELFFNLGVSRKFINAFVVNLVPLFVIALLLFAHLLTVSKKEDLMDRFGFDLNSAIATYSAALFIILLAHVQVRSQFADSGVTYIEYFYLIMYLMILLCATNSFIFTLGNFRYLDIIHYRDNLIPKLAYWPLLLGMMAIATWLIL